MYAGGANFTSLFFMNIYRIYIFVWSVFAPCWWFDKKGEKYFGVYICKFISFPCFIQKEGEGFWEFMHIMFLFMQNGEKNFWSLCMFISLFMHICLFDFMHFIVHLFVYCYAWVKGELLWSLTLIHAYITLAFISDLILKFYLCWSFMWTAFRAWIRVRLFCSWQRSLVKVDQKGESLLMRQDTL